MKDHLTEDARETFAFLSNEYAEALQAFDGMERQAGEQAAFGTPEQLHSFIDPFVQLMTRLRDHALRHDEPHFAEWFGELIDRADALREQAASEK